MLLPLVVVAYVLVVAGFRVSTWEADMIVGPFADHKMPALLLCCLANLAVANANHSSRAGGSTYAGDFAAGLLFFAIHRLLVCGRKHTRVDMKGKTCVVTGANSGIGLEVSRELASMGADVILACRTETRAKAAIADILASTGCDARQLRFQPLDLCSVASISSFVREVGHVKIDVLVNNAGCMMDSFSNTDDGFESTVRRATNAPAC